MDTWGDLFSQPLKGGAPLRVGIALCGRHTSRWQGSVIEEIQASEVAQVVMVLSSAAAEPTTSQSPVTLHRRPTLRGTAWRIYEALDAKRAAIEADPCETCDVSDLLGSLPQVALSDSAEGGIDLANEARDAIEGADLDVIVELGGPPVPAWAGALAREGVWAYRGAGDDLAEFRMLAGPAAVTDIALVRRSDTKHGGRVLATATFARDAASIARFRSHAYFGVTHLVVAELQRLQAAAAPSAGVTAEEAGPMLRGSEPPRSADVVRWLAPLAFGKAVNRLSSTVKGKSQHWQIGYRPRLEGTEPTRGRLDMESFTWVSSPAGRFYADPFLHERDGRTWLFIEDCAYDTGRGTIAVAEVDQDGLVSPFTEVIRSRGHLSYPYVFEADGEVFMIPESAAEGQVRLYRARSFPYEWEIVKVLYHGRAVDTSAILHEDRWWFFTTLLEPRGRAAMMMLFGSDSLTGEWASHPMNPVSRDIRNIRGAGSIRYVDGQLVRPSQDCSHSYGYALSWMGVDALDESSYRETPLGRVEASATLGMTATHTHNATSRWETVDGRFTRADGAVR